MKHLRLVFTLALMLAACTPSATPTATPTPTKPPAQPTATALPPTAIPMPQPAGTRLSYEGNAQVEIISAAGTRVLLDIAHPNALSSPPTDQDILLTTHTHSDHYSAAFVEAFPGQQLLAEVGQIKTADVTIQGLASAHNAGDSLTPEGATNYLYIIDLDGLRLVHFGDIGQDQLTDGQLAALGKVDIAITQFVNPYSAMDLVNQKGFNLIAQVKPRLIIPTHTNMDALKYAVHDARWHGFYANAQFADISADKLPAQTSLLIIGTDSTAAAIHKYLNLATW